METAAKGLVSGKDGEDSDMEESAADSTSEESEADEWVNDNEGKCDTGGKKKKKKIFSVVDKVRQLLCNQCHINWIH